MFKVGDRVICIKPHNTYLFLGEVYTIESVFSEEYELISLVEVESNWNIHRFILATPLIETLV
jgi:hypothetical protein